MLQDLEYGRLENEYRIVEPTADAKVVCANGNKLLVKRASDDTLTLPTYQQVMTWAEENHWQHWYEKKVQYVFRMQEEDYFIWMGEAGESGDSEYGFEAAASLRQMVSKNVCYAMMTAWHLFDWYRSNRFCGRCGAKTQHDEKERMMRCPECNNMIFPKIAPSVIVGVIHGDKLLLSKYANRSYTRYGMIAGFTEIGETVEETVAREVMEEVGLKVKNIRYYKTQPWGVTGGLLLGYYCDLDGEDDTITLDREELAMAEWFPRNDLPAHDDGISLTREMIRVFEEGREPK